MAVWLCGGMAVWRFGGVAVWLWMCVCVCVVCSGLGRTLDLLELFWRQQLEPLPGAECAVVHLTPEVRLHPDRAVVLALGVHKLDSVPEDVIWAHHWCVACVGWWGWCGVWWCVVVCGGVW